MAPRDISGRSTGSQNPGQFDGHEERTFAGIGYDASTAGWGSSVKQESDADRPNPVSMAKFEFNDDEDYAACADGRDEEESLSYRNAQSRAAARPRSLSGGAARDPCEDRDTRSGRERARDSRDVLRGLEAIHDRKGPIGPATFDPPNITFGGPLRQRVEDVNRGTGSSRITERAANVVEAGASDGRLASALEIEDRPSIASPLEQDLSNLEPLRSSDEFTPQWGSASRERSASAKRPSPLAGGTDRSKARRASPEPIGSMPQDEDMFDPADIHIHSTPESRGSNVNPRSIAGEGALARTRCSESLMILFPTPGGAPELKEFLRGSRYRTLRLLGLIPLGNPAMPGVRRFSICASRRCLREVRPPALL